MVGSGCYLARLEFGGKVEMVRMGSAMNLWELWSVSKRAILCSQREAGE